MKKKFLALPVLMVLLALPALAFAVDNFVTQVISKVLTMLVWPLFVGAVVIMSVWAGFLYLTAHGEPEKIKTANKAVIFIVIGIIVAILGYRMIATVNQFIPNTSSSPLTPPGGACTQNSDCQFGNCLASGFYGSS